MRERGGGGGGENPNLVTTYSGVMNADFAVGWVDPKEKKNKGVKLGKGKKR